MNDDELRRLFQTNSATLRAEIQQSFDARLAEILQNTTELRQAFETNTTELRQAFDAKSAETVRHFHTTAEDIRHDVRLLAEVVGALDEKLDRETADIRAEMRSGFSETQAMIKFSHVELDQRLTRAEQKVSGLETRVEQLEANGR